MILDSLAVSICSNLSFSLYFSICISNLKGPNVIVCFVGAASVGLPRYHETSGSTSFQSLWHPPPTNHWQQNHHSSLPTQGFRGHNINLYPQAITASYRIPSNVSPSNINPSHNGFEMGGHRQPVINPSTGFRIFRPHHVVTPESSLRHQNLPHMRFLQADVR